MPERRISHFEVLEPLGVGGMGEVFLARDSLLDRRVALKFLPRAAVSDPVAVKRFTREAKAASALDHPNIGTIFEIGQTDDGDHFIAMALYDGGTVTDRMRRGAVDIATVLSWGIQLADGLGRAHSAGIVHRDIKPSNLLLTGDGLLKIVDFGIAKIDAATQLTEAGSNPGTPAYMAPEQIRGVPVDARCDLWATGVVLFELLTGRRPFVGQGAQSVIHNILVGPVPDARGIRPDLPDELVRILARCLARHPDSRYSSAEELAGDLRAFATRPIPEGQAEGPTVSTGSVTHWADHGPQLDRDQLAFLLQQGVTPEGPTEAEPTTLPSKGPNPRRLRRAHLVFLVSLGLLIAVAVGLSLKLGRARPPVSVAPRQIAVLPLGNLTGDPELDWYGVALARLVADNLAHDSQLRVSSSISTAQLVSLEPDARAVDAQEKGVDLIVGGEVLRGEDGTLAVTHRLTEVESSTELDGGRSDGVAVDRLTETADTITRQVQMALGLPPEKILDVYAADFATTKPGAYAAFLEGTERFADFDYEGARVVLSSALELDPDFAMARYRLAWALASSGQIDQARQELEQAIARSPDLPDRERRYLFATQAYFDYDLDRSIEAWRELLELYPYEIEARLNLATLLYQSDLFEEELAELETLERLEPGRPGVASMMGEALLAKGAYGEAASWLERYLELDPSAANGHDMLARAFLAQGELVLAKGEFRQALEIDPGFLYAEIGLATVLFLDGEEEAARRTLQQLVDDPETPAAFRLDAGIDLAYMLRAAGRLRESSALLVRLDESLVSEGARHALALVARADNAAHLGEWGEARSLAEQAVAAAPEGASRSRFVFHRGRIELLGGETAAVERACEELLTEASLEGATPDQTQRKACDYLRASSQLFAGDHEEAVSTLREALLLEGHSFTIYRLGLAQAYLDSGRFREALGAAREILDEIDLRPVRLDLALERREAELVLAEAQLGLGQSEAAAERARTLLRALADADPDLPLLERARQLASED